METVKIYETDGGIFDFSANVISCALNETGTYDVVLDKTAFFPGGGGQEPDEGTVGGNNVIFVKDCNGKIVHVISSELAVGTEVFCSVNRDLRFSRMQAHTGEHILSGVVHSLFGYDNVGFHMGKDFVTVDYNGTFSDAEYSLLEKKVNEAVYADLPITISFPNADELLLLKYRSKKELTGRVRIVTIKDCDVCACCAPHLNTTGQVGIVKLLDRINWKGGTRLHLLCGFAALRDYEIKFRNCKAVAEYLKVTVNESANAFTAFVESTEELKRQLTQVRKKLASSIAGYVEIPASNICVFQDDFSSDDLRTLVNGLTERTNGLCGAFSSYPGGYIFVIGSKTLKLKGRLSEINNAISGKSGGSDVMITGRCSADKNTIVSFFESFK